MSDKRAEIISDIQDLATNVFDTSGIPSAGAIANVFLIGLIVFLGAVILKKIG